jgi:hypothetical protein
MSNETQKKCTPSLGNVVLRLRKAPRANARVSSSDFLHRLTAPTLPPVKCNVEYNRDAASSRAVSVGMGTEPFKNFRDSDCKAACWDRCRVGYNGISRASTARHKSCGTYV